MALRWPWLVVPAGHVRASTLALTVLIALVVVWRTRRTLLAAVAVMAWLSAFEIAWQTAQAAFGRIPMSEEFWFVAAVVGWVVLAHHLGIRPDPLLTGLFVAGFAVWVALGFHSNWPDQPFSLRDEATNELTKTALGVAYLLGALRAARPAPVPVPRGAAGG